ASDARRRPGAGPRATEPRRLPAAVVARYVPPTHWAKIVRPPARLPGGRGVVPAPLRGGVRGPARGWARRGRGRRWAAPRAGSAATRPPARPRSCRGTGRELRGPGAAFAAQCPTDRASPASADRAEGGPRAADTHGNAPAPFVPLRSPGPS